MDLSIVIPTYNEKENIQALLEGLFETFEENRIKGEVIVVDDNSKDVTGSLVENLKRKYKNLKVIHRKEKLGLSSAVLDGWKIADSEILGVMDADLSHPVEKIPEMLSYFPEADLVIGSRYVKNGRILGWDLKRKVMSRFAIFLSRPFTRTKDPMTGYFMVKKSCLIGKKINPKGFKILLEVLIKSNCKKIREVPITFVNRIKGKSKASLKEIFYYLYNLIGYVPYSKGVSEFFKFAYIGLMGTVLNLFLLSFLTEFAGVYYIYSAIIGFVAAATHNYVLNKIWTFKEVLGKGFFIKGVQFFIVSLIALAVNVSLLYFFTEFLKIYYVVSQAIAILITLFVNFFGNKIWTFKK